MTDIITRIITVIPKNKCDDDKINLVLKGINGNILLTLNRAVDAEKYSIYQLRCDLPNSNTDIEFDFPDIWFAFGSISYDDRNYNHVNQWHKYYCSPEEDEEIYSVTVGRCGAINFFVAPMGG